MTAWPITLADVERARRGERRDRLRAAAARAEGAGAAGLAGLMKLLPELAGQRVGVVLSGGNLDRETLQRVLSGAL